MYVRMYACLYECMHGMVWYVCMSKKVLQP